MAHDQFDDRTATRRKMSVMGAANAVDDDELAGFKAETHKAIGPPRRESASVILAAKNVRHRK